MSGRTVYMDYNATTPVHPDVARFLREELDNFANASSMHEMGRRSRASVETARGQVAALIGAKPREIVFTSGGSESNNTVFMTMFEVWRKARLDAEKSSGTGASGAIPVRDTVVTSVIEHPCVLNSGKRLEQLGMRVIYVPVDSAGRLDIAALEAAVDSRTLLVSVMAANNEIGTLQDLPRMSAMARKAGAFFHTDAVQAAGKIPVDVSAWGCDYLTLSAHKIYGPKGVGALYVKDGSPFEPLVNGGHQEGGKRAGTYNSPGIAAFGLASEIALRELRDTIAANLALRARLRDGLAAEIPVIRVNGHATEVLPNTLNVSFPGAEGEAILLSLDLEGVEVSTGSACASGSLEPSHVLMATGVGPELAHGSIRFSLGRGSSEADVDYILSIMPGIIERLRKMTTVDWRSSQVD